MLRPTTRLAASTVLAVTTVIGCASDDYLEREPTLSDTDRRIIERKKQHGKEWNIRRPTDDGGAWNYSSKSNSWSRTPGFD